MKVKNQLFIIIRLYPTSPFINRNLGQYHVLPRQTLKLQSTHDSVSSTLNCNQFWRIVNGESACI